MKQSRRARRIQRHYRRMHRAGGLNLVSLMDIFTILVFFLMVNSSDVKVLQQSSQVDLPVSEIDRELEEALTIEVAGETVLVQGHPVASTDERSADGRTIPALEEELARQARRIADEIPPAGLPVTIMGDRQLPYEVLRTIMQTSVDAGFRQVRLAVERREAPRD